MKIKTLLMLSMVTLVPVANAEAPLPSSQECQENNRKLVNKFNALYAEIRELKAEKEELIDSNTIMQANQTAEPTCSAVDLEQLAKLKRDNDQFRLYSDEISSKYRERGETIDALNQQLRQCAREGR